MSRDIVCFLNICLSLQYPKKKTKDNLKENGNQNEGELNEGELNEESARFH